MKELRNERKRISDNFSIKKMNPVVFFFLLLLFQIIVLIYWGVQKSNFYWDEYWSFNKAHYISDSTPEQVGILENSLLEREKWIPVSIIKDTYMVTRENSLMNESILNIVRKSFSCRPYMMVLNFMEAFFFDGEISKWSGILINIMCFVVCQIILYRFVSQLTNMPITALLCVGMFGFCGMTISMVEFVRFYVWVTMLLLLCTYLHYKMWNCQVWYKNLLYELFSLLLLYWAYLDSELVCLYGVGLMACFSLALFIKRRYKQFMYYTLPLGIGGFWYLWNYTDYIRALFNPTAYMEKHNYVGAENYLLMRLSTLSPEEVKLRWNYLMDIFGRFLFGNSVIFHVYIFFLIILFLYAGIKVKNKCCKQFFYSDFIFILFGILIIYLIASISLGLDQTRYNSSIFPVLTILFICIPIGIAKNIGILKPVTLILIFLICCEVYFTCRIPQIENIYREDRLTIEMLQNKKDIDSVIWQDDSGFILQDCITWVDDSTKVYFSDAQEFSYEGFPDDFLLWHWKELDDDKVKELKKAQYDVENIGKTYLSVIYQCRRTS